MTGDSERVAFADLVKEQIKIGWDQFIRGPLSTKWGEHQNSFSMRKDLESKKNDGSLGCQLG